MEQSSGVGKTQKATLTRQRILDSALALFAEKGYEGTTMRDIAAQAGCSLGLAYRYFSSKEEFILILYQNIARDLEMQVQALPPASLAARFRQTIQAQISLMRPHREMLGTIFGVALNPRSQVGIFADNVASVRRQGRDTYKLVVAGARDAPREAQIGYLATILYCLHLALVLFWLQDRSQEMKTTDRLLAVLHDGIVLLRPFLPLPPVAKILERLATILGPMFGDDHQTSGDMQ